MNRKKLKWLVFLIVSILGLFYAGITVLADDDEKEGHRGYYKDRDDDFEEREEYEHYENDAVEAWDDEEYDDDESYKDDDDDYWQGNEYQPTVISQKGYWNFWQREPISAQESDLPIKEPGEVTIKMNGTQASIHVIPQQGQLLVPAERIAKLLGAKSDFYSKSRIIVISKNKTELIVRAGSNAAYENGTKTPMPIQVKYIEKSLYLPISAAANAFGCRVSLNETEQALILEKL